MVFLAPWIKFEFGSYLTAFFSLLITVKLLEKISWACKNQAIEKPHTQKPKIPNRVHQKNKETSNMIWRLFIVTIKKTENKLWWNVSGIQLAKKSHVKAASFENFLHSIPITGLFLDRFINFSPKIVTDCFRYRN